MGKGTNLLTSEDDTPAMVVSKRNCPPENQRWIHCIVVEQHNRILDKIDQCLDTDP